MIRRTQAQWRALFIEHQASGLKAIEFCNNHNICPNYFSKRKTELLSPKKIPTQSSAFVSVTPTTHHEATTLSIHHEQTILTIPMSVRCNLIIASIPLRMWLKVDAILAFSNVNIH